MTSSTNGATTTLTLSNPERRNALSHALLDDLIALLREADEAGSRVIILRAQPGVHVWSAGHDIDELPGDGTDPLTWANPLERVFRTIRRLRCPVIVAVEGTVWGGATELVLSCDLVVAVESATFAITPARLGIPYNTEGVARFVESMPVNLVRELFFTADPIDAATFARLGVVNRLVPDEPAMTAAATVLADRIATLAPLAIAAIKAEISALTDARPIGSEQFERLTELRQAAWRSDDYREALTAFKERRPPVFRGE